MKPSNPSLNTLLEGEQGKYESKLKEQTEREKQLGMLEQFEVTKTFFYQGIVRPKGTILWMKPHTARDYIVNKVLKKYVAPVNVPSLFSSLEEQRELLNELNEKVSSVENDGVLNAKGNRPKRA